MSQTPSLPETPYRVLARKYRPQTFAEVMGQDVFVQILKNAIESNRVAHAFIFTGVRGVGKTTTARLLARALNCVGPDGTGTATITPCGLCTSCLSISEDRSVDVIEMDAASRTGVEDIRELIEGVRYRPVSSRFKVYIIDEVHMLSRNAFNALLKTLEEPPAHVKFIFATTEIKKVPVTILSRCQRFDLKRADFQTLETFLASIAKKEGRQVAAPALKLLASAADGSFRDGLSLLDQALSLTAEEIQEDMVQEMLGLADASLTLELFQEILKGETAKALEIFKEMVARGSTPSAIMKDLLDLTHWLSQALIAPHFQAEGLLSETLKKEAKGLLEYLTVPLLARYWQLLLKGILEVEKAPHPQKAAEMVVIRLTHVKDVPLLKEILSNPTQFLKGASRETVAQPEREEEKFSPPPTLKPERSAEKENVSLQEETKPLETFEDLVAFVKEKREPLLYQVLLEEVEVLDFTSRAITLTLRPKAPKDLAIRLKNFLKAERGEEWQVHITSNQNDSRETLFEQKQKARADEIAATKEHPLVKQVLEAFPEAQVADIIKK